MPHDSTTAAPLRVALNHGNFLLVGRDEAGAAKGISVDLAHAFAASEGREPVFVEYNRAVDVSSSAEDDAWDVCFLAVDPERARTIAFTEPYVRIDGSYLAGPDCTAGDAHALVASGEKVGAVRGSAYSLTLQRKPGAEALELYETLQMALEALDRGEVQALAGIRQAMMHEAETRPGSRLLAPPFMEIRQAMAMPQGRPEASARLQAFLSEALRDGTVGDILERHGVSRDCAIVPA
ncbi:MAG: hypothetical protein CMP09_21345 [Yangia sp.]|nr:hypothetical protein [Salipiger sp.]